MERTFIMLKPDAVKRGLVGQIIARFEAAGFAIEAIKRTRMMGDTIAQHYSEHVGKPFYPELEAFTASGPVIPMILSRENAIASARELIGATNSAAANPGTIRRDFWDGTDIVRQNLVHASDSVESATREIALHFRTSE